MLSKQFLDALKFNRQHGEPSFYQGEWRIVPPSDPKLQRFDIYPDYSVDAASCVLPANEYACIASAVSGNNVALVQAAPELYRALDMLVSSVESVQPENRTDFQTAALERALVALGRVLHVYP